MKRAIPRGEQNQVQQSRGLSSNNRSNGRSNEQSRTKKIFVGGLSANLTEDEFKSYFEQFGRITDVVVMHDNVTQRPRGFGFITFDSEDAVEDVMMKSFHELGGKHAEVKRAIPKDGNNNGYNSRVSSGRGSNFNSYQNENFQPYSPRYDPFQGYGHLSGYGPLSGYGGVAGYPYGVGMFGGGYPTGGYGAGYGMTPFAPRSPWTGPAMIGVGANYYPAYMNGGVGVTGGTPNGYNGIMGMTPNGKSSQLGVDDAQMAADRTSSQIEMGNVVVNSLSSGGSCGAAATKTSERGIDGQLISYSASDSS